MENDDKRTSRDDETFPPEAEADAAHDDDLASPEAPLETASEPDETTRETDCLPENRASRQPESA